MRNFKETLTLMLFLLTASCTKLENPKSTPSQPSSVTSTSTFTQLPPPTKTPAPEVTESPKPTWTPLPTLSEEETLQTVEDLVRNNAGCRLPCWWDITPGVTTWEDANHFLVSFATENRLMDIRRIEENDDSYIGSSYGVVIDGGTYHGAAIFKVRNDTIHVIQTYASSSQYIAQLHQLLANYGAPGKIFLRTFDNSPGPYIRFTLILYYQDQRILAWYEYEGHRDGNIVRACPTAGGAHLILWADTVHFDREEIEIMVLGPDPTMHLRMLEDVTDYSLNAFRQTFMDPTYSNCIETPVEYWE